MRDVKIGFKFHDGMAEVPVMGRGKDIVAAFGILAASIARNLGIPLGVLIAAAVDADKNYDKIVGKGIVVDCSALHQQRDNGAN